MGRGLHRRGRQAAMDRGEARRPACGSNFSIPGATESCTPRTLLRFRAPACSTYSDRNGTHIHAHTHIYAYIRVRIHTSLCTPAPATKRRACVSTHTAKARCTLYTHTLARTLDTCTHLFNARFRAGADAGRSISRTLAVRHACT